MRILGIDPGIGRMGWAIIDSQGQKVTAISYGCIETHPQKPPAERLLILHEALIVITEKYKPDTMGIEDLFFAKNAKTAFVVGQARGVILLTAQQKNLTIGVY